MSRWVDVVGYEGLYQVHPDGRIRSLDRRVKSKGGARVIKGKELRQFQKTTGYWCVGLYKSTTGRQWMVHRILATAFIPNPESKPHINHKDSDRTNNSLDNLEWVTAQENIQHAHDAGRYPKRKPLGAGDESIASKLTSKQVIVIKRLLRAGCCYSCIGNMYGVSEGTIGHIRHGRTWTTVA